MLRSAMTSIATVACLGIMTGCTDDQPSDAATPTGSTDPSTVEPSRTTTVPAYMQRYSEAERAAYDDAVQDYRAFARELADVNEVGRATPEARAMLKHRTASWRSYWARLRANEDRGIRIVGMGRTLRTRPADIRLDADGGGRIRLRVCGVSTGVRVLQDDEVVPQPSPTPTTVRVDLVRLPGESHWRVLSERVGSEC